MEGHEEAEFVCQMIYNLEVMGESSGSFGFFFILVETLWEFYHLACSYKSLFPRADVLKFS